jgi:hypothetical protein
MREWMMTGALWLFGAALGCGAEQPPPPTPPETELPQQQSLLQAETPPPATGDAEVDEAIATFQPRSYSGESGRVGARVLQVDGVPWDSGFLLKDGRVYFHAAWKGCVPNPSDCDLQGARELSVAQMERLMPVIEAHAVAMDWWPIPWETLALLQRTVATWKGEPLPAEVRVTAAEGIRDFIAWGYGYQTDAQGAPVMIVSGNPHDLGFLMKDHRVYFHDRWTGCVPDPRACAMDGAVELSLEQMQQLLPNLEARATALGETWVLSREAVELLKAAIADKQS